MLFSLVHLARFVLGYAYSTGGGRANRALGLAGSLLEHRFHAMATIGQLADG